MIVNDIKLLNNMAQRLECEIDRFVTSRRSLSESKKVIFSRGVAARIICDNHKLIQTDSQETTTMHCQTENCKSEGKLIQTSRVHKENFECQINSKSFQSTICTQTELSEIATFDS
ncbi:hypothetical protein ACOME3_002802 [Neoechinorhynchus agilis]